MLPSPVYASSHPALSHHQNHQSALKIPATHNVAFTVRLNPIESALTQVLIPQDINLFSFRTYEKTGGAPPDSVNQLAFGQIRPQCRNTIGRARLQPCRNAALFSAALAAEAPSNHSLNFSLFFLPVVRRSPMLPQEMLVVQMLGDRPRLRIRAAACRECQ